MSFICKLDNSIHESVEGVHAVLKRFKVKQSDYWQDAFPRYNITNGKLIPFKSYDQYMSQDFENKNELKAWIKKDPVKAKAWAIEFLKKRREEKHLSYAPSQVELRTLVCPSMPYYDSIGGYYNITKALGYDDRYNDNDLKFIPFGSDVSIIQDTREQEPLKLSVKTEVAKVDAGDYALSKAFDKGIYIERKSLNDYCGTMSKGNVRFRKELERATKRGHYIVMLVEATISDSQSLEYLPHTKHVKASSIYIAKQLRDLLVDFPFSFQVVFVDGRIEAAQKLIKIFELGVQVKSIDLQNAYEKGLL